MTELDKLVEAVEAADWLAVLITADKVFPKETADMEKRDCYYWVLDAYRNNDLNAARRLHDALLPGWVFDVTNGSAFVVNPESWDWGADAPMQYQADGQTPARAWLLAILKAQAKDDTPHA